MFATGFDAMTGALSQIDITGAGGQTLAEKWRDGPRSLSRPGPGRVPEPVHHHRARQSIGAEQHGRLDRAARRLDRRLHRPSARSRADESIEATDEAEEAWVDLVAQLADFTLFPKANSWYVGANVEGKPRVFMPYVGGVHTYRQYCDQVVEQGYEGFSLT